MERIGVELPANVLSQIDIPMDEIMYSTVTPDIVTMAFWTAFLTALFGSFIPAIRAAMLSPVNAMNRRFKDVRSILCPECESVASGSEAAAANLPMRTRSSMRWTNI